MAEDRVTQLPVIVPSAIPGSIRVTQLPVISVDGRKNNCRVSQYVVIPLTPGPTNPIHSDASGTGNSAACPEWLRQFPDTMLLDIAANDSIFPYYIRQC